MDSYLFDEEMREYYARRAGEYDNWWLGSGGFAQPVRHGWSQEVAELIELVAGLPPQRVLDVACGTGFLTAHLAGEVTAVWSAAAPEPRYRSSAMLVQGALAQSMPGDAITNSAGGPLMASG